MRGRGGGMSALTPPCPVPAPALSRVTLSQSLKDKQLPPMTCSSPGTASLPAAPAGPPRRHPPARHARRHGVVGGTPVRRQPTYWVDEEGEKGEETGEEKQEGTTLGRISARKLTKRHGSPPVERENTPWAGKLGTGTSALQAAAPGWRPPQMAGACCAVSLTPLTLPGAGHRRPPLAEWTRPRGSPASGALLAEVAGCRHPRQGHQGRGATYRRHPSSGTRGGGHGRPQVGKGEQSTGVS